MKIISFEGGIGAGKTSLTNYFSKVMKVEKILEDYSVVPFLEEYYADAYLNRANSYIKIENFRLALKDYERFVEYCVNKNENYKNVEKLIKLLKQEIED